MKLLALRCPQCDAWLQPQQLDVVLPCPACKTAVYLQENGLSSLPVTYAAPQNDSTSAWLPFWRFYGHVHLERRDTQGGGGGKREAAQLWSEPRHFFVPAWELPIRRAREMGSRLVSRQPTFLPFTPPEPPLFQPATLTPTDAQKLLELIILTIEAQRSDWLKDLQFRLELGAPEFWLLPAHQQGDGWALRPATKEA